VCWGRLWGLWATQCSMAALHIVPSNTSESLWWCVLFRLPNYQIPIDDYCSKIEFTHPCTINNPVFCLSLQCSGPSMEPTIVNHDIVFCERMTRQLYKIQK